MADLPMEARSVYDLVHGELDGLLDRKLDVFADKINKTINDKLDATTSSFNNELNDLRDEISFGVEGGGPYDGTNGLAPQQSSANSSRRAAVVFSCRDRAVDRWIRHGLLRQTPRWARH